MPALDPKRAYLRPPVATQQLPERAARDLISWSRVIVGSGSNEAGRVGEDVATLTPHRPGRADFRHPVCMGLFLSRAQSVIV